MIKILNKYSSKNDINITQIIAYKNDEMLIEENRYNFKREDTMNIMSVTKSITSLLIGIAIDKGFIKSVDDKILDYFPNYKVVRGEKTIYDVTIKHMLTMTAPYKGQSEPWTRVCTSNDWVLTTLDIVGGKAGITGEFRYHTLGIQVLLGIIKNASKINTLDFANKYLFEPLGIKPRADADCQTKEDYFNYLMNKGPHGNVWFCDPIVMPTAGWGLSMSDYEMAQIGLMILHDGEYKGKRIISKKYIDEMTNSYVSLGEQFGNQDYGYLWWLPYRNKEVISAMGDGGNTIYINKRENIVCAITGYFKPMVFDRTEFIEKNIVEAIKNKY